MKQYLCFVLSYSETFNTDFFFLSRFRQQYQFLA